MSDLQAKKRHCEGCHDDYYNQPGNSTTGYCWSLPSMVLTMRKEVSIHQRPPWTQEATRLPDCYHRPQFVYVKPDQTR